MLSDVLIIYALLNSQIMYFYTYIYIIDVTDISCLLSLMLFTIGSFALHVPTFLKLKTQLKNRSSKFGGKSWVVLVAGSSGWSNYRHQVTNII